MLLDGGRRRPPAPALRASRPLDAAASSGGGRMSSAGRPVADGGARRADAQRHAVTRPRRGASRIARSVMGRQVGHSAQSQTQPVPEAAEERSAGSRAASGSHSAMSKASARCMAQPQNVHVGCTTGSPLSRSPSPTRREPDSAEPGTPYSAPPGRPSDAGGVVLASDGRPRRGCPVAALGHVGKGHPSRVAVGDRVATRSALDGEGTTCDQPGLRR